MVIKLYYEVKVRYERIDDAGKAKKVTELYIVSALESQDVEIAILSELSSYRYVEILSIRKVKIDQVIAVYNRERHREKWYRVRCAVINLDDNDRPRRTSISVIINADDFDDADNRLHAWLDAMTSDIELLSLSQSSIKGWLI
ncbi:DUF4494 family protein [Porphyromonas endodontalis]|uniref:DUF4494 family protein n=1 Tax=Porphyromonas endodontalis TaxID=28124 RepID=UPI0028ECB341|nr:DUF4494 family protein [Porphyromonas endodontalis]